MLLKNVQKRTREIMSKGINSLANLAAAYGESDEDEEKFAGSSTLQSTNGERGIKRTIHEDVPDASLERTRLCFFGFQNTKLPTPAVISCMETGSL